MSSEIINQSKLKDETIGLMEDLAELLQADVPPTHLPLFQLIDKICKDPALSQVDLYSKYFQLATVVGGDWITAKEELRNASRFGAPAVYCSVSAMLAFTFRRSRSHEEQVDKSETKDNQKEKLDTSVVIPPTDSTSVTSDIFNVDCLPIPGTRYRCRYGTLTIDGNSQFLFDGVGLDAKIFNYWLTLPISITFNTKLMNLDLTKLLLFTKENKNFVEELRLKLVPKKKVLEINLHLGGLFSNVKYQSNQWYYLDS